MDHELEAFRVMQLIPGIGPSAAANAMEAMERALDTSLGLQFFRAPARAGADWPGFVGLFTALRTKSAWPTDLEQVRLSYEPHLDRLTKTSPRVEATSCSWSRSQQVIRRASAS